MIALCVTGCESVIFGVINRGLPPPSASVVFDSSHQLALDVYRPVASLEATPVVVFFHGGSWQRGERAQYQFIGTRLAANGVLAIIADYRTFPRTTFPGFMKDAASAIAWTKVHAGEYGGDPDKLFIAGHSAGAQIAALLGTDARYLAAVHVEQQQVAGIIGLSGPYDFDITGKYRQIFDPPSHYPQAQAVNFVDGNEPRFLLVHGTRDKVVEYRDSIEMAERINAAGGQAQPLLLPDAGHFTPAAALYRNHYAPEVLPAILDFIKQQGPPTSAGGP